MKIQQYIKESFKELREEVTWPTWPELQRTTGVVIAGSVFLATLVWSIDYVWALVLGALY